MDTEQEQAASALWTLFDGRRDCYGKGTGLCVKKAVTLELVARHLAGEVAIGVYPLTPDGRCHWTCVDLDCPDEPEAARWAKALALYETLRRLGAVPFIERSKSKGHHLWVFFREPVESSWARSLARRALADAGLPPDVEIFPKHDFLSAEVPFSGYVNLPYFGPNGDGRRCMVSPSSGQPWTVTEFLDALTLTDPNDVLLGPGPDTAQEGDVVIEAGEPEAAPLLGEDAPYGTRHAHAKKVAGLLVRRLWLDGEQAVLDAALLWNTGRCKPPLPEAEVRDMVRDFWRKEERRRANVAAEPEAEPTPTGKAPPPPGGLKERTAAELMAGEGETLSVDFLPVMGQDGFIIKGWSHILASYPKTGKTELLADAVAKWTGQGLRVLFFTEEPEQVWRLRLQTRPPAVPEALTLVFALLAGVEAVESRVAAGSEQVVVVDTTRNVLGLEDEKDNSAIARTIGPLISTCRLGDKTLVLAHHHVKAGGEHGRGIAGGHAFLGIVDVALEILREQAPNRRRLEGQARIVNIPALLYEMAEDGTFTALGAPEDVSAEEVQGRVRDALTDDWQATSKVREALGEPTPSADGVLRALHALAGRGEAERQPPLSEGNKQGKRYTWRAPTSLPL